MVKLIAAAGLVLALVFAPAADARHHRYDKGKHKAHFRPASVRDRSKEELRRVPGYCTVFRAPDGRIVGVRCVN